MLCYSYFLIACTLALGIGAFWFIVSTTKEIKHILHSINDTAKAKKKQSDKVKILFAEYVNTHAVIKQLSMHFKRTKKIRAFVRPKKN